MADMGEPVGVADLALSKHISYFETLKKRRNLDN